MARDSSAPKLPVAERLELPEESPRAKRLRVCTESTLAGDTEANRTALSDSAVAAKLRILRTETGLTQEDAAALGEVASRSVGRYERSEVDLSQARYVIRLFEFRARQRGDK